MTGKEPRRPDAGDERHPDRRTSDAERRRRRAKVFGQVLPEGTGDERPEGWGEREQSSDEWLRGQVPPHHG